MKQEYKIIRNISLENGIDERVVQEIVYHPLKFAKRRIEDDYDYRPIRIRYFGTFVQKEKIKKEMRNQIHKMREDLDTVEYVLHSILGHEDIITKESAAIYLTDLYSDNDIDKIKEIWDAYCEYNK